MAEPGLDVPEGAPLNLSCRLPGGPGPIGNSTFAWFWNGQRLHVEPGPTLAFTHVARAQAGVYHCRAQHPSGTTTSAPVMLRVLCEYDPPPPPSPATSVCPHLTCPPQVFLLFCLQRAKTLQVWSPGWEDSRSLCDLGYPCLGFLMHDVSVPSPREEHRRYGTQSARHTIGPHQPWSLTPFLMKAPCCQSDMAVLTSHSKT